MCLLVSIPEGASLSYDRAAVAADNNPDGFGWAVIAGTHIIRYRSMSFEDAWAEWEIVREWATGPAVWHWRFATGGRNDVHNCHPFEVGGDSRLLLAHNGVLPIKATRKRSDTRILAEDRLAAEDRTLWDSAEWRAELGEWIGANKLVFLSVHPEQAQSTYIINEDQGHWDEGVWWSNHSYEPWVPPSRFSFAKPAGKADDDPDVREIDVIPVRCDVCGEECLWDGVDDRCPTCLGCLVCGAVCLCRDGRGGGWRASAGVSWDDGGEF